MTNVTYEKQWADMVKKFQGTTDKLGLDIDEKIFDTIIALNMLGISTSQSCEGHLEHGLAGPWVVFGVSSSPETDSLKKQAYEKYQEAETCKSSNPVSFLDDPNYRTLMDNHRALLKKSLIPTMNNVHKIVPLLEEFYQNRHTQYLTRLVLSDEDSEIPRLRNQGVFFQDITDSDIKNRNLLEFQKEMAEFTDYLKHKLQKTL